MLSDAAIRRKAVRCYINNKAAPIVPPHTHTHTPLSWDLRMWNTQQ